MVTAVEKVIDNIKENKQSYLRRDNLITLIMWGLALGSHAFLLSLFICELYRDITKHRPPRPFCLLKDAVTH